MDKAFWWCWCLIYDGYIKFSCGKTQTKLNHITFNNTSQFSIILPLEPWLLIPRIELILLHFGSMEKVSFICGSGSILAAMTIQIYYQIFYQKHFFLPLERWLLCGLAGSWKKYKFLSADFKRFERQFSFRNLSHLAGFLALLCSHFTLWRWFSFLFNFPFVHGIHMRW